MSEPNPAIPAATQLNILSPPEYAKVSETSPLTDRPDVTPHLAAPETPLDTTQWDLMVAGKHYNCWGDRLFVERRLRIRRLLQAYNDYPWSAVPPTDFFGPDERRSILADIFHLSLGDFKAKRIDIEPPLLVNFGQNVTFKGEFYANSGLLMLDNCPITFGHRILCGPRVAFHTPSHSLKVDERRQAGWDFGYPIEIGDDCWIGGGAVFNGPCKVGNGCTIAGGAVVRGTFPDNCLIGGVPARIIKYLDPPKSTSGLDSTEAEVLL